jgi:hypothetical protein
MFDFLSFVASASAICQYVPSTPHRACHAVQGVVMINVIASISIKEGKLSDYRRLLKANIPRV